MDPNYLRATRAVDESVIPEKTRAWIYRISLALVPLATGYGVIEESKAALWIGLIGAALGFATNSLAAANTSTKR
jgi:hypothetical protein